MTNERNQASEIEALERLVEAFGADRTRWPARARLRFASVLAEDGNARRLVAEAAALDRILDMAPLVPLVRQQRLADRIVASAMRNDTRLRQGAENVVPLSGAAGRLSRGQRFGAPVWKSAAVLAASLVLGILAGSNERIELGWAQLVENVGSADDGGTGQLALGVEPTGLGDEDLL